MAAAPFPMQERVLLKLTTTRDGALVGPVLQRAGIVGLVCPGLPELTHEFDAGAGVLVLAEEALAEPQFAPLRQRLQQQEPWSDIPVLLLVRGDADSPALQRALEGLPNVTVVERPLRAASLLSLLRSALRARGRQYELRRVLAGLRDADRRKDEFLATLAHELRNPLAPIANAAQLLQQRAAPEDAALHAMVGRQLAHLVRLVDDLMEVSRITRGRVELRSEDLHIAAALDDALDLVRPLMQAAGHRLLVHPVPPDAWVHGDRVRLAQVFSNLLANAAKYTPAGGTIVVAVQVEGGHVNVDVTDNGRGIEPALLESIFEMFVQGPGGAPAAQDAQGGLGIGLTLARSLVELHHGRLRARSGGPSQGSTFSVTLPKIAAPRRMPAATAAASPASPPRPRLRVLVTDDNRDAADSLGAMLRLVGHEVTVAYSGADALSLARAQPFDAAVLDVGMAGLDGCTVARTLRAQPDTRALQLIALTGWGGDEDHARVLAAGFDHHLLKPAQMDRLLDVLRPAGAAAGG